ncbi:MAG: DUF6431 domain-containing protein [Firmicutes bacterium]|nr:DUF6431 domain-containing protein [Bacillota bacterium]
MVFLVRSAECLPCPCCQGVLVLFGRRWRSRVLGSGEKQWLIIRRLRCVDCNKIHHELPDVLAPYKRYEARSIEQVIENRERASVAADESTLDRWRAWFAWWAPYACGCLEALRQRFSLSVEASSSPTSSALRGLGQYVGNASAWLARTVRPIVNAHLHVATRSAWMST